MVISGKAVRRHGLFEAIPADWAAQAGGAARHAKKAGGHGGPQPAVGRLAAAWQRQRHSLVEARGRGVAPRRRQDGVDGHKLGVARALAARAGTSRGVRYDSARRPTADVVWPGWAGWAEGLHSLRIQRPRVLPATHQAGHPLAPRPHVARRVGAVAAGGHHAAVPHHNAAHGRFALVQRSAGLQEADGRLIRCGDTGVEAAPGLECAASAAGSTRRGRRRTCCSAACMKRVSSSVHGAS